VIITFLGLEVAVDEPGGVRRDQAAAPGGDVDIQHLAPAVRSRLQPVADRVAFDELHRDEDRFPRTSPTS